MEPTANQTMTVRLPKSLLDAAQQRLRAILQAANALICDGYVILFLDSDAQCVKPIIHVMSEPRLWAKVAADEAVYVRTGTDMYGRYRVGQIERDGALVRWLERGH